MLPVAVAAAVAVAVPVVQVPQVRMCAVRRSSLQRVAVQKHTKHGRVELRDVAPQIYRQRIFEGRALIQCILPGATLLQTL